MEINLEKVQALCERVIGKKYSSIKRMGGLTNYTYHVAVEDGKEYVVRLPGEGTEALINRSEEKISTKLACDLDLDAECLYFGEDGSKVTAYIPDAVTMSADSLKEELHIRQIAEIFQRLHTSGVNTGVAFDVFDMAAAYENIITEKEVPMYKDYPEVKKAVMKIKREIDQICRISIVPCHNDGLCENWVTQGKTGRMYLIDWEYAGMNDAMWDLADVSIEASYDQLLDTVLLKEYLRREPEDLDWKHFLAAKIYVDFLWTLWAKTRVPYDGQSMEDWAAERYDRLKKNTAKYQTI